MIELFEIVSGWLTRERFEAAHAGHVTFERDLRTGHDEAFLWTRTPDGDEFGHQRVRWVWMLGREFFRL